MDRRALAFVVVTAGAVGCGGPGYKLAAVSGRVTLDGKALADATVQFYPFPPPGSIEAGPTSIGHTDENGRYTLALGDGTAAKGAVVGKHKVFINLTPKEDPADARPKHYFPLPARYNRKTELEREVPAGGTDAADFALTTK